MGKPDTSQAIRQASSLGKRVSWLISLRWLAIISVLAIVTVAARVFDVRLRLRELFAIVGLMAVLNIVFFVVCRVLRVTEDRVGGKARLLANAQITADLVVLAALIRYTGGIENPFAFYFIFHIIVSGTLLPPRDAWLQAGVATALFCGMVELERSGVISHYHVPGLAPLGLYRNSLYVTATVAAFASTMCLAAFTAISATRLVRVQQRESADLIQQLQQAYSKLGELERSKSRYMRRVSHELRAPLAASQNLLTMVEESLTGEGSSGERELVGRAVKRTDQALKLVSDLLILARSQEARFAVGMRAVSLSRAIREVSASLQPRADKAEVALAVDCPLDLPLVSGDRESLEQLITNLTSNAIKYTPKGGRVSVSAAAQGGSITLSVSDTGIGISEEDLPCVFDEFYRGKNAREFDEQGTGLGLSIVKSIADTHGAKVHVESVLGQGTTFVITMARAGARAA
ncbi:MAG: HAMP domain-containing histidine kinase [Armatimonadota bacterium]|nr:MAG: HAMP domain-containing histidine kinase [Armatimonadota bacterium]